MKLLRIPVFSYIFRDLYMFILYFYSIIEIEIQNNTNLYL